MIDENSPKLIEDDKLDDASGGILVALLVPAVQKIQATPTAGSTGITKSGAGVLVLTSPNT